MLCFLLFVCLVWKENAAVWMLFKPRKRRNNKITILHKIRCIIYYLHCVVLLSKIQMMPFTRPSHHNCLKSLFLQKYEKKNGNLYSTWKQMGYILFLVCRPIISYVLSLFLHFYVLLGTVGTLLGDLRGV